MNVHLIVLTAPASLVSIVLSMVPVAIVVAIISIMNLVRLNAL